MFKVIQAVNGRAGVFLILNPLSIHSREQKGPREGGCPRKQELVRTADSVLRAEKVSKVSPDRFSIVRKNQLILICYLVISSRHFPETDYRREQIVCADISDEMWGLGAVGEWSQEVA